MSVRYLALELYRWTRRVEELEKSRAALEERDFAARSRLEEELLKAKKEVEHYRALLAAKKERPLI